MIVQQIRLQVLLDKWQANYLRLLEKEAATQTEHEQLGANLIHAISITSTCGWPYLSHHMSGMGSIQGRLREDHFAVPNVGARGSGPFQAILIRNGYYCSPHLRRRSVAGLIYLLDSKYKSWNQNKPDQPVAKEVARMKSIHGRFINNGTHSG